MTYSPWETNFVEQVQRLREQAGMTQTDLAKKLKDQGLSFHQQTVARIEAGTRPVRLDEAFLIASVFGVELGTMTNPPSTPKLRDLAFAADRAQRRLDDVLYGTQETLVEFLEHFESLAYEVQERVEGKRSSKDLDEVTRAALHYLFELDEIWAVLLDAYFKTGELLGKDEQELSIATAAHEDVQGWIDTFIPGLGHGPNLPVDTYNELMKLLKAKEEGES